MLFIRGSRLKITYTSAFEPDPDVTFTDWLVLPGLGAPRAAYHALKGGATDMTWPQGAAAFGFPMASWYGNQLLTDIEGRKSGIRSWSITALPGKIPGRLTVASYKTTNLDNAAPDDLTDYDLGTAAWESGALPVHPTDGSTLWREPLLRFVPINLLGLL